MLRFVTASLGASALWLLVFQDIYNRNSLEIPRRAQPLAPSGELSPPSLPSQAPELESGVGMVVVLLADSRLRLRRVCRVQLADIPLETGLDAVLPT